MLRKHSDAANITEARASILEPLEIYHRRERERGLCASVWLVADQGGVRFSPNRPVMWRREARCLFKDWRV